MDRVKEAMYSFERELQNTLKKREEIARQFKSLDTAMYQKKPQTPVQMAICEDMLRYPKALQSCIDLGPFTDAEAKRVQAHITTLLKKRYRTVKQISFARVDQTKFWRFWFSY